jgi:hypothetical protein
MWAGGRTDERGRTISSVHNYSYISQVILTKTFTDVLSLSALAYTVNVFAILTILA